MLTKVTVCKYLKTVLIFPAGSRGTKASTAFPYFLLDMAVAGLDGEHQLKIVGVTKNSRALLWPSDTLHTGTP